MARLRPAQEASGSADSVPARARHHTLHYQRHPPASTTLYRLVQQHAASFIAHTEASTGAALPRCIRDEFDAFLECGILAHKFLMLRCGEAMRTRRPLQAAAIIYRIALGLRAGQKVLTLRGAMPREATVRRPQCADIDGFSLHAAVRVEAHARKRLEHLCRYITRTESAAGTALTTTRGTVPADSLGSRVNLGARACEAAHDVSGRGSSCLFRRWRGVQGSDQAVVSG